MELREVIGCRVKIISNHIKQSILMIAAIMVHQQGRKSHTYFYECGTRQQTMELHDVIICRVKIVTEDGTKSTRSIVAVRVL